MCLCQARTDTPDLGFDPYQVALRLVVLGIAGDRGLQDGLGF